VGMKTTVKPTTMVALERCRLYVYSKLYGLLLLLLPQQGLDITTSV
jgi:hypothetical protein